MIKPPQDWTDIPGNQHRKSPAHLASPHVSYRQLVSIDRR